MSKILLLLAMVVLLAQADAADVRNRWIVRLKPEASQPAFTASLNAQVKAANTQGGSFAGVHHKVVHTYRIGDTFKGYAGTFSSAFVEQLKKDPAVASVEPDAEVRAFNVQPNPPSWGLTRISERNLDLSAGYVYPPQAGEGVDVYVVDTGIKIDHPDFEGRAQWAGTFCDNCADTDDNGHGTHCAGTIGSATYGVAKKASLYAVKVLGGDGSGTYAGVIKGIEFVASKSGQSGRKVVASMSLGGPKNQAVNDAVKAAVKAGVVFTVAAGNDSKDACQTSPASEPSAITVGATDKTDALASYSNFGSCVDINAPGTAITSTWNSGGVNTISGTSMATPHTAGVVALLLSIDPTLTPDAVAAKLADIATRNKIPSAKGSPNLILNHGYTEGPQPPVTSTTVAPKPTSTTVAPKPTSTTVAPKPTTTVVPTPTPTPDPDCPWWAVVLGWC